jgi:hypothetical protein
VWCSCVWRLTRCLDIIIMSLDVPHKKAGLLTKPPHRAYCLQGFWHVFVNCNMYFCNIFSKFAVCSFSATTPTAMARPSCESVSRSAKQNISDKF